MRSAFWVLFGISILLMCEMSLAQNSASGGAVARTSCSSQNDLREAREVFKNGIIAFERKDFLESAYKMLRALDFNCGEKLKVVVPYGRWRYTYLPKDYLGVSLHRLGHCLMEGRNCSRTRDWNGNWPEFLENELGEGWQEFLLDSERQGQCANAIAGGEARSLLVSQSAECDDGSCLKLRFSNPNEFYCPAVDWWIKLRTAGIDVPIDETQEQIEKRCELLTTPSEWFWSALRGGDQCSNRNICLELTEELSRAENSCSFLEASTSLDGI